VEIVRVAFASPLDDGVTVTGLKLALAPAGSPEADRLTGVLEPLIDSTTTVKVYEVKLDEDCSAQDTAIGTT
jgi:hypothetical protein